MEFIADSSANHRRESSPLGYLSSLESMSHLWEGGETPVLYQVRTFGSGYVIPIR